MLTKENADRMLVELNKEQAEQLTNYCRGQIEERDSLQKKIDQIQRLEKTGLIEVFGTYIPYAFDIAQEKLPALRRVVGSLEVVRTHIPSNWNAETSPEITVVVKPKSNQWNELEFRYRKPYKNRGKCKVVESTSTYTTKKLVCPIEE